MAKKNQSRKNEIFIRKVKKSFRKRIYASTSLLFAEQPVQDIDAGCLHKSAHSTDVSLDEAGVLWTFIPRQLPIHPTAITAKHRSCRA